MPPYAQKAPPPASSARAEPLCPDTRDVILNPGKLHEGTQKQWDHYKRCLIVAHGLARFVMWGKVSEETADNTLETMANSQPLPRNFYFGNILEEFEKYIGHFIYFRQKAPWAIKKAIKSFIEALKPAWDIWLKAMDVNKDAFDDALSPHEVLDIVKDEIRWSFNKGRKCYGR